MSEVPDKKDTTKSTKDISTTKQTRTSDKVDQSKVIASTPQQNPRASPELELRGRDNTQIAETPSTWRPPTPPPDEKMAPADKKKTWLPWLNADKRRNQQIGVDDSLLLDEEMPPTNARDTAEVVHDYHRLTSHQSAETLPSGYQSSREEAVMKECDFFYKGDGEQPLQRNTNNSSSQRSRGTLQTDESNPRFIKRFRHEYESLNAPFEELYESSRYNIERHDNSFRIPRTAAFTNSLNNIELSALQNSSMVYYRHGRLELRLPNDHIRLMMEPDLEPGILSIENETKIRSDDKTLDQSPDLDQIPNEGELSYVLTVEEDLYRRLFTEIADSGAPGGLYFLFHDDDERRVGVGIAVCILVLFFVCLSIGIGFFPTN